jgi:hypothetical protein
MDCLKNLRELVSGLEKFKFETEEDGWELFIKLLSERLGCEASSFFTVDENKKTISFARLLGRALARTHIDGNLDASWTFLTQEDLKKTDNLKISPSFFYNIVRNLRELIPFCNLSLLFWQSDKDIYAMTVADEEKNLIPLAQQLGVSLQSKFFVTGPFNNFSEAELHFRKALEEMVSLKI